MVEQQLFIQASGKFLCIENPTMTHVYDVQKQRIVNVKNLIGDNSADAFRLRMRISAQELYFLCPECNESLLLRMREDRSGFYFSHKFKSPECPIKEKRYLSRSGINKKKFQNSNESTLHNSLKHMLAACLKRDDSFSKVEIEKWWKAKDSKKYRRPDVQANHKNGLHLSFEIQLSTTYSDDIAERMEFAKENDGLLIWVANSIDKTNVKTAVMDTMYANNANILIFDEDRYNESLDKQKLHFECCWLEFNPENPQEYLQNNKIITFDELTLNQKKQWAYYFNFEERECIRKQNLKTENLFEEERISIESKSLKKIPSIQDWNPNFTDAEVVRFLGELFDASFMQASDIKRILNIMISGKKGSPVGWNFKNNKQLFHQIYKFSYKKTILFFWMFEESYHDSFKENSEISIKKEEIRKSLLEEGENSRFYPPFYYIKILEVFFPVEYEYWLGFKTEFNVR